MEIEATPQKTPEEILKQIRETGKLRLYKDYDDTEGFEVVIAKPAPYFRIKYNKVRSEYIKNFQVIKNDYKELMDQKPEDVIPVDDPLYDMNEEAKLKLVQNDDNNYIAWLQVLINTYHNTDEERKLINLPIDTDFWQKVQNMEEVRAGVYYFQHANGIR